MRSTDAITRAWQDRACAHEIDSVNGSRGNIGNIWFPIKSWGYVDDYPARNIPRNFSVITSLKKRLIKCHSKTVFILRLYPPWKDAREDLLGGRRDSRNAEYMLVERG